jgi:hypothetical protein
MIRVLLPVSVLLAFSLPIAIRFFRRAHWLHNMSWDELVIHLEPVLTNGIREVALEHLRPRDGQVQIDPKKMFELVGGMQGLGAMRRNTRIVCALAAYAERWNYDEASVVTTKIRRDASVVRRATAYIMLEYIFNVRWDSDHSRTRYCLEEAASAYYLMRERLLALYRTSHIGRYSQLAQAL